MFSWSSRRKSVYLSFLLLFAGIFLIIWSVKTFYKKPSCADGLQNQGEIGVDCGGPCTVLCGDDSPNLSTLWTRVLRVRDGVYSVVAKIENPSSLGVVGLAPYQILLYDKDNVLVLDKSGEMYIPPKRSIVFFEGGLNTGDRIPVRGVFNLNGKIKWSHTNQTEPDLKISASDYDFVSDEPYLKAKIENRSLIEAPKTVFIALIYDASGNVVGSSRTELNSVKGGGEEEIVFTWPNAFSARGVRFEVLYWRSPTI